MDALYLLYLLSPTFYLINSSNIAIEKNNIISFTLTNRTYPIYPNNCTPLYVFDISMIRKNISNILIILYYNIVPKKIYFI